jgi:ferredoxin
MDEASSDKIIRVGKYNIQVLRDVCIGAATCVAIAAETFKLDEENKSVVLEGGNDAPDAIVMAAQGCPTKSIVVTDAETGEKIWPAS